MQHDERKEDIFQRINIMSRNVPSFHSPNSFNIDKYMEKDNTKAKRNAADWGSGDFAAIVRRNSGRKI